MSRPCTVVHTASDARAQRLLKGTTAVWLTLSVSSRFVMPLTSQTGRALLLSIDAIPFAPLL